MLQSVRTPGRPLSATPSAVLCHRETASRRFRLFHAVCRRTSFLSAETTALDSGCDGWSFAAEMPVSEAVRAGLGPLNTTSGDESAAVWLSRGIPGS